ncbi:hypothetical protein VPH35_033296 [Triticum aestivum]|uniref:uncharacterized protein n=1 Tax=Triticum aestivum TaxID=4565 RepID=UPI0003D4FFAF|nr:uncharacterized protein LOC123042969 [Triticum aestivum]XP_044321241.1 uncharacterized protein LOC123042969 [Triticum aestivum]
MGEMVASAVVQEAVSGAVSLVFSSRTGKASQEELMERLEMAHIKLHVGLERTEMMPITIMPLLRLRKKLKDVFKECDDLLSKVRDQQVVPSLRRKIMHAVLPSFIVPSQDMLSSSVVGRFEWFAKEADKFVRDMESGCSLSQYRFLNPLTRHLLEGQDLSYHMVRGSQTYSLWIWTASVEDNGRVARLYFEYKDRKTPVKSFRLFLVLRLYESTNIVGVTVKCLQSLGPSFKSLAEVATGEITQVPTQDVSYSPDPISWGRKRCGWSPWANIVGLTKEWSPDPFCCILNGLNKPSANNIILSELTGRFQQDVVLFQFTCSFSASEYCSRSSTDEARINTTKAWPPLDKTVIFAPHASRKPQDGPSLHQKEDGIQTEAIDCFIRHPEQTKYDKIWYLTHGWVIFRVSKPITTTRRASKRRR